MKSTSLQIKDMISPGVRDIPPSGIRKYFDVAAAAKDVISLGVGEPDFVTPERIREACIRALEQKRTTYTSNAGLIELREAISEYLHRSFHLDYSREDEIIITVGGSEAIDLVLRTLMTPGDEVLVAVPTYVAYSPIAQLNGGKSVEVETFAEDGFKLRADVLRSKITPRSKLLIVSYPNNPTGAVMSHEDWLPIAELAEKHNLIVLSDEIYAELTYSGKHTSIASLPGMKERTVVISGFSKAFSMTGWRVGYACASSELISAMLKIHQYTVLCAPTLSQIGAVEALRSCLQEKDAMVELFNQRRRFFIQGLRDLGLVCHEPQGAFYVFPSILSIDLSSEVFAERLLQEARVAAVPGHVFGQGGEGYIRCSYAASVQQLTEALNRMERFIKNLPRRGAVKNANH
ncbi:aminotransferase class I/II-fold pyridoxal phosphate-dependent enzyme [Paenibacillus tarimensis]